MGGWGGVSPDTFTANWLPFEGGGQFRYVHREGLHCGGGRGRGGSVLIRGYLLPWAATPLRRAPPPLAFVAPGVPLK